MSYHALSCLGDAVDATRAFLVTVDRSRWLRLAVVVFFLSGGTGVSSLPNASGDFQFGEPGAGGFGPGEFPDRIVVPAELLDQYLPLLLGLAIVFGAVGLVFALVGSLMEFVLVDSLRTESVTVRASMRDYLGGGLALFVFRLLLWVVTMTILGSVGYVLLAPALAAGGLQLALSILLFLIVAVIVGLTAALVNGFTTHFVVPTMIHEDRGLRDGWGRFWPVLRDNPDQFVVYVVVRLALTVGVSIIGSLATGLVAVVLTLPFLLVGGAVWVGVGGTTTLSGAIAIGLVVAAFVLVLLAITALVQVPLKTFTRYYELLVLGDIDPQLDLVADRRRAIREK